MGKRIQTRPHERAKVSAAGPAEHVHHGGDDVSVGGGALPHGVPSQPLETPDTQEALFAEDGVWEVSEADGSGPRHASEQEMQIEADGLTVIDAPEFETGE
jgi:hypothetical protein